MSQTRNVLQIDRDVGAVISRPPIECVYFSFTAVRHLSSFLNATQYDNISVYIEKQRSNVCGSIVVSDSWTSCYILHSALFDIRSLRTPAKGRCTYHYSL